MFRHTSATRLLSPRGSSTPCGIRGTRSPLSALMPAPILSGMLIDSAALSSSASGRLSLTSMTPFTRMLISRVSGTASLTLSLNILALGLTVIFATRFEISAATLCRLTGALPMATLMLSRFLRYAVRQFSFRITRAFAFGFLRNVPPNLLLLLLVFDPIPAVIDFIGAG